MLPSAGVGSVSTRGRLVPARPCVEGEVSRPDVVETALTSRDNNTSEVEVERPPPKVEVETALASRDSCPDGSCSGAEVEVAGGMTSNPLLSPRISESAAAGGGGS